MGKYISRSQKYAETYNEEINFSYERSFSKLIGKGSSISFGSARMAFYTLMKVLNLSSNDE